jgi:CheY-like chemotaxis protein
VAPSDCVRKAANPAAGYRSARFDRPIWVWRFRPPPGNLAPLPSTSFETILVLEENAAVQELIDQALRESGHRVLSTKDALEALEVARRIRVDVLVAGVLLEARRQTLIGELRAIQPGLRIVNICGPDDDVEKIDRSRTLSSPFSLDELREAVAAGPDQRGDG